VTDGEVIRFPKAPDDAERGPLRTRRRRRGFDPEACKHPHPLVLDEEAHELRCGKCGQTLDIFDFLLDWIARWESYNLGYQAARQQERAARSRVETLKRHEKNAKARIRKGGVVLSVAQARVVRDQLVRLQHVAIEAVGSLEETQRLARLGGVDAERLREATRILGEQVDLPDEHRVAGLS
jgi:hypothetical protein